MLGEPRSWQHSSSRGHNGGVTMAKSYEEAVKEIQRETPESEEHLRGMVNYAEEQGMEFDGETLEEKWEELKDISITPPEFLSKAEQDRDFERSGPVDVPSVGIDLGSIEAILEGGNQIEILGAIGRILLASFATLVDISNNVAPASRITISGINALDNANAAQPVVPESDNELIPTRWLYIKADSDNDEDIAIGDDDVAPTSGFILTPGEAIYLEVDIREEEYYMASEEAGEQVNLLGGF